MRCGAMTPFGGRFKYDWSVWDNHELYSVGITITIN
jgi:hypothetical protein